MRLTAGLVLLSLLACSKGEATKPAAPTSSKSAEAAALPSGFQNFAWGTSFAEVRAAYPKAEDNLKGALLSVQQARFAGRDVELFFLFDEKGGLYRVGIVYANCLVARDCQEVLKKLEADLAAKYGPAHERRVAAKDASGATLPDAKAAIAASGSVEEHAIVAERGR